MLNLSFELNFFDISFVKNKDFVCSSHRNLGTLSSCLPLEVCRIRRLWCNNLPIFSNQRIRSQYFLQPSACLWLKKWINKQNRCINFFLDFKILISYHACVFQWSLHSVPEMDVRKSWDWELSLRSKWAILIGVKNIRSSLVHSAFSAWFILVWHLRASPCYVLAVLGKHFVHPGASPCYHQWLSWQGGDTLLYIPGQVPANIPAGGATIFCRLAMSRHVPRHFPGPLGPGI